MRDQATTPGLSSGQTDPTDHDADPFAPDRAQSAPGAPVDGVRIRCRIFSAAPVASIQVRTSNTRCSMVLALGPSTKNCCSSLHLDTWIKPVRLLSTTT